MSAVFVILTPKLPLEMTLLVEDNERLKSETQKEGIDDQRHTTKENCPA
jgi:hypothetical protein